MRRVIVALTASLAVPAGLIVALPTGSAFASSAVPTIVTCSKLTGTSTTTTSTGTATGCNQTAITGGSGTQTAKTTSAGTTFSLKWKSGKTTTGKTTFSVVTPSKCPSTFSEEVKAVGTVTGGTATKLKGGKTTNTICVSTTTGKFELLPGSKYKV